MNNCKHENFQVTADVHRITDGDNGLVTNYDVDIRIVCVDCNEPFIFVGLPTGYSPRQPMVSYDGAELRAPIMPKGGPLPRAIPGFSIHGSSVQPND